MPCALPRALILRRHYFDVAAPPLRYADDAAFSYCHDTIIAFTLWRAMIFDVSRRFSMLRLFDTIADGMTRCC